MVGLNLTIKAGFLPVLHKLDFFIDWVSTKIVNAIVQDLVWRDPQSRPAFMRVVYLLRTEVSGNYVLYRNIFLLSLATLLAGAILPILFRAIFRRKTKVFISFAHQKEQVAKEIEQKLARTTIIPSRIPYVKDSSHQDIVGRVEEGIKDCNLLICIPSMAGSFVDSEVLAASVSRKPIVFVISDSSGSLPDTADKRYPVFSLEKLTDAMFKPLIIFCGYLTCDLASTKRICWRSARDPGLFFGSKFGFRVILGLFVFAFYHSLLVVHQGALKIANVSSQYKPYLNEANLVHLLGLSVAGSISMIFCLYTLAFLRKLITQFISARRARLRAKAGIFHKSDWKSVMPDMGEGQEVYACLMDEAPKAHHELK